MLVLTRRLGESITIDDNIRITVVQIKGKQVRLGIEAPKTTAIHREEIYKAIQDSDLPKPAAGDPVPAEHDSTWARPN